MRFALPLVLLLLASVLSSLNAGALKLASDVWPPFTDQQGWTRVSTDLVTEALKRSGMGAETVIVDFTKVIPGIKSGQYDGSAAMWKDPQREQIMLFSKPYLENRLILVGGKDSDVSARSLADLKGKKVGIVGSYSYGDIITAKDGPSFVKGRDYQQNLNRLLAGEVDYVLLDSLVVRRLTETQGADVKKYLTVGSNPLLKRSLHFALRKDVPNAVEIIEAFNANLQAMTEDGSLQRILKFKGVPVDFE